MPHIKCETSIEMTTSEKNAILHRINDACFDSNLFITKEEIKSRFLSLETSLIGNGDNDEEFFSVTIEILSGRTPEQKIKLASLISSSISLDKYSPLQISINIVELEREFYLIRKVDN
ncbi:hypothetical protein ACK3ZO_16555 [Aeromonas caviae]